MTRTFRYRLFPRRGEKKALDFILEQGRMLYNTALEQRVLTYQASQERLSYPDQWDHFRDERNANLDTLGQMNAASVQQLLRRLDKSFKAFFRRLKAGEKPGFPRFKGRNRFHSVEYRYGDGCKLRENHRGRKIFYIQNVGEIKVKDHRPIPEDAKIKNVVLKRSLGLWYVCLQAQMPDPDRKPNTNPAVGVDMGLKSLLAFSDGTLIENPRWLRNSLDKLRKAQRRMSRRQKGSHRRRNAAFQVAQIHERIRNQRLDFWHKLTRKMANTYGLIALEDLNLNFMRKNPYLALSASDAGLGMFQQLLGYKAEEAGCRLVVVNPKDTSQECNRCGEMVPKSLSVRMHHCYFCGLIEDRDVNAARNILHLGLSPPGRGGRTPT